MRPREEAGAEEPTGEIVADLGFAEAFAEYGAKLRNVQWSVCADAPDGALVAAFGNIISTRQEMGRLLVVALSLVGRARAIPSSGKRWATAFSTQQPIKVVIAHTTETDKVESGADASALKKWFSIKKDWIGRVASIAGDEYVFEFSRRG
jgi:hypothetical protein